MAEIQQINNQESLSLLTDNFFDKEKFKAILEAMADQYNDLETSIFEIRDNFYVDSAEGVQLDIIAEILGIERNGANDDDFRDLIKAEFSVIFTSGEPESIISILQTIYGATFVDYYPGHLNGEPAAFIEVSDSTITKQQLEAISPAGVAVYSGDYLIEEAPTNEFIIMESGDRIIIT